MKIKRLITSFVIIATTCILSTQALAKPMIIAAASDLKYAMDEIIVAFKSTRSEAEVDVVYGSSGKLRTQIEYGAPFDLYFSADISYPEYLHIKGFASSEVMPYALGRLVLWSNKVNVKELSMQALAQPQYSRIAIANPKHAPYGIRAKQVIENLGLWPSLAPKLIYAESVSHAAQYVQTQHADVGLIALSLVLNEALTNEFGYQLISAELHEPLEQGFIITKYGSQNGLAKTFAQFVQSDEAKNILAQYGFTIPTT